MSWLDLHLHSNFSDDGELSPKELMTACLRNGVKFAAVADHNSTRGVEEARYWAGSMGIDLIPAVELDCVYEGVNLHVLGYWVNPALDDFARIEEGILRQEREASKIRIALVRSMGIPVTDYALFRLAKDGVVTGEMIAEAAMQQDGNRNNPLLAPYYSGGNRCDNPYVNFYWDFCSQGKPAYAPVDFISLSDAVGVIRRAEGIAVLAHPGNNIHENEALLRGIAARGVCGVEVYSSYHTAEQTAFYRNQAELLGLAMSCGSDFHGKTKPKIGVGSVECENRESELLAGLLNKRI